MFQKGLLKNLTCFSLVVDKINMHQAFDLEQDLLELSQEKRFPSPKEVNYRIIITTNNKENEETKIDESAKENFNQIKEAFMGKKDEGGKALVIQLNEDQRIVSKFEKVNHYYVVCNNDRDKFLLLFAMKKLSLVQGKTVIYVNDVIQAYRIKFFLARFKLKTFVIAPEMAKQQISSIIHFFTIGQFDTVIVLNSGYQQPLPPFKEVNFAINFQQPETYAQYKDIGAQIENEQGAMISFFTPEEEKKSELMLTVQKKTTKAYGRNDMIRCLPVIWHELVRMKSRTDEVF